MPKKIFTQELEGTRRRGRPRKRWKEEVERDLQVLGLRRWRELVADRKKNGRTFFDRPTPTVDCRANGRSRRRRIRRRRLQKNLQMLNLTKIRTVGAELFHVDRQKDSQT